MMLSLARSPPIYLESIDLDPLYRLDYELRQIVRRHPFLEIMRQQERLRAVKLPKISPCLSSRPTDASEPITLATKPMDC